MNNSQSIVVIGVDENPEFKVILLVSFRLPGGKIRDFARRAGFPIMLQRGDTVVLSEVAEGRVRKIMPRDNGTYVSVEAFDLTQPHEPNLEAQLKLCEQEWVESGNG